MLDIKKLVAQGEIPEASSWDDFMQFWKLEDEELEYIKAQIQLEE